MLNMCMRPNIFTKISEQVHFQFYLQILRKYSNNRLSHKSHSKILQLSKVKGGSDAHFASELTLQFVVSISLYFVLSHNLIFS